MDWRVERAVARVSRGEGFAGRTRGTSSCGEAGKMGVPRARVESRRRSFEGRILAGGGSLRWS